MSKRILIVDDEKLILISTKIVLESVGYEVLTALTGEEGLEISRRESPSLILLDIMMPGIDGFEVLRQLRARGDDTPVLILSARSADLDRIRGLELRADDYLTKPFNLRELLARIKGIFRREEWFRSQPVSDVLELGDCRVNLRTFEAETLHGPIKLKEKEVMILRLLAERQGEPVDRATIINQVWGYDAFPTTRTVDNFILSLRKTLEGDPTRPQHLQTVHGIGYRLVTG